MGVATILSWGKAISLVAMVFALIGIVLSLAEYAAQEFSITDADYSTHTKAFCSPQDGMLYCEDKLVVEHGGESRIAEGAPITGNAFIEAETF